MRRQIGQSVAGGLLFFTQKLRSSCQGFQCLMYVLNADKVSPWLCGFIPLLWSQLRAAEMSQGPYRETYTYNTVVVLVNSNNCWLFTRVLYEKRPGHSKQSSNQSFMCVHSCTDLTKVRGLNHFLYVWCQSDCVYLFSKCFITFWKNTSSMFFLVQTSMLQFIR